MAADARREHVDGVVVGAQAQQVVAPVEQVLLARRQVRGALVDDGGGDIVARPRVHVAEQVEQLGGLLRLEHPPHLLARGVERAGLQVGDGEIVAVGVVGRVEHARALEVRDRVGHSPRLEVERGERVVRREAVGRGADRLDELSLEGGRVRSSGRLRERGARAGQPEKQRGEEANQVMRHGAGVRAPAPIVLPN